MRKVVFLLICCVAISYAIVPMNVGNKWYYHEVYRSLYDSVIVKKTSIVQKDTIDNGVLKKKITNKYNDDLYKYAEKKNAEKDFFYTDLFPKSQLFYENENNTKFYINGGLLYVEDSKDSIINSGSSSYSRLTIKKNIFSNEYTVRTVSSATYGNSWSQSGFSLALGLGVIAKDSRCTGAGAFDIFHVYKSVLVAAIIDGKYLGDSLATTAIDPSLDKQVDLKTTNYPNPFNNTTAINYTLPRNSFTELSIFNSKGEFVRSLFTGIQNEGVHQVDFDATSLNSGIYFYKLSSNGQSVVKKMILVK